MNTNTPAVFQFQSVEIRAFADEQGEPWFLANDVCAVLGYMNPRMSVERHCRAKGVTKRDTLTAKGMQESTYINEGNLYRLIIKSRKPEAEAFEQEVMEVILPTIRKTGHYEMQAGEPSPFPLIPEGAVIFHDGEVRGVWRHAWDGYMAIVQMQLTGCDHFAIQNMTDMWLKMYPKPITDGILSDIGLTSYKAGSKQLAKQLKS